jgi:hypothetical protein
MEGNARTWFTPKQKAEPRTPTACCDSISQREQISSASLRRTWTGSPCGSIKPAEDVGLVLQ